APAGTGFNAQCPIKIRAIHDIVEGINIFGSARYFTADDNTAVSIFHHTIFDDMVFGRPSYVAAVLVATRFNRNTVVAGIEIAVSYPDVLTRFRIAAIVIRTMANHLYPLNQYILT